MKKHKKLFIIIPIVCVLCVVLAVCLIQHITDNNYKKIAGYEEYISDRDSGYSYAPYFGTKDVMNENKAARDYYYANSRKVRNYLITDYEDGICINDYYGNESTIDIPEKLDGKPVVKIGGELRKFESMDKKFFYYEYSPFSGKGSIILNIPSTVKYISKSVLETPRVILVDEDAENWFSIAEVNVDKDNPYYCSEDGVLYSKDMKSLLNLPNNYDIYTSNLQYIIPDSVENFATINGFKDGTVKSFQFGKNIKIIDTIIFDGTGFDIAENNPSIICDGFLKIKGYKGTVAEEWAKKYHAEFIPLD